MNKWEEFISLNLTIQLEIISTSLPYIIINCKVTILVIYLVPIILYVVCKGKVYSTQQLCEVFFNLQLRKYLKYGPELIEPIKSSIDLF
jgi:hypothetical protein